MPGFIVHDGATVNCEHLGNAKPIVASMRVFVSGKGICTIGTAYSVAGCGLTGTSAPPCVAAAFTDGATRVASEGLAVVLDDSESACVSSGGELIVVLTQTRAQAT